MFWIPLALAIVVGVVLFADSLLAALAIGLVCWLVAATIRSMVRRPVAGDLGD